MEEGRYGVRFLVDDQSYCVWDWNPTEHNRVFIENFDPIYFEFLARAYASASAGDNKQRSATALRAAYSHGLETFFALLAATLQIPVFIPGWLLLYEPRDLRKLVNKISSGQVVKNLFRRKLTTWESVVRLVHPAIQQNSSKGATHIASITSCWSFFAHDFLRTDISQEYNSIKHGFRTRPGGIDISAFFGDDESNRYPALSVESEYGSGFLALQRISGMPRHHRQITAHHINWHADDMVAGLRLLALSLHNLLEFLRYVNGLPTHQQHWPEDLSELGDPWQFAHTIDGAALKLSSAELLGNKAKPFTKEEIASIYGSEQEYL